MRKIILIPLFFLAFMFSLLGQGGKTPGKVQPKKPATVIYKPDTKAIQNLQDKITKLNNQLDSFGKENDKLKSKNAALEADKKSLANDVKDLQNDVKSLKLKLESQKGGDPDLTEYILAGLLLIAFIIIVLLLINRNSNEPGSKNNKDGSTPNQPPKKLTTTISGDGANRPKSNSFYSLINGPLKRMVMRTKNDDTEPNKNKEEDGPGSFSYSGTKSHSVDTRNSHTTPPDHLPDTGITTVSQINNPTHNLPPSEPHVQDLPPKIARFVDFQPNPQAPDESNSYFYLDLEQKQGEGEDANPLVLQEGKTTLIGVFDGMGGAGAAQYWALENPDKTYTGAFLASRYARNACAGHFERHKSIEDTLKDNIIEQLLRGKETFDTKDSRIKSRLIKVFPTTMALLEFKDNGQQIIANTFWAGDSRCYALDHKNGLQQLTKDHLVNEKDAFQSVTEDSTISNCICLEQEFKIDKREYRFSRPVILIAASDGAYGYLPSPWHFENAILEPLVHAQSVLEWKRQVHQNLAKVAGDDITMVVAFAGYDNFEAMKHLFHPRYMDLKTRFLSTGSVTESMWLEYKKHYYANIQ